MPMKVDGLDSLMTDIAAMAAQYWGKGDKDSVERIQHIALRYTMPFSILTFVVALFFPDALMRLFTDDPDMLRFGVDYKEELAKIADELRESYPDYRFRLAPHLDISD